MLKVLALFPIFFALTFGADFYITTGHTGAQTQIDTDHTSSWTLNPSTNFTFGGGIFTMKDGSSTTANIVLSLYQGTSASGTLLGSLNLT